MARVIGAREQALRLQREQEAKQTERPAPRPRPAASQTPVAVSSVEKIVKKLPAAPKRRKAVPARKPRKTKRAVAKKGGFCKNDFQRTYMVHWRAAKKLGIPVGEYIASKKKKRS